MPGGGGTDGGGPEGEKNALESVCSMARQRLDISDPALLLALLDACEVTRDAGMLQEVLDVVGRNLIAWPFRRRV